MRRSPLARGTKPLERRTRVKARRATPRKSGRVRDAGYMAKVRALPCYVCGLVAASVEADHQGPRPFGRKADDSTCVPMCRWCHASRTDGFIPTVVGPVTFERRWVRADKYVMAEWCERAIAATRAALGWIKKEAV